MLSLTCVPSSKFLDVSIRPGVTAETRKWGGGSREGQQDIGDKKWDMRNVKGALMGKGGQHRKGERHRKEGRGHETLRILEEDTVIINLYLPVYGKHVEGMTLLLMTPHNSLCP